MPARWPRAKMESESDVLAAIRALDPLNVELWRNNRGKLKDKFGRWVAFGVGPNGASDLIGYRVIRITPAHVGSRIAQFTSIEVKKPGEEPRDDQTAFLDNVTASGGCAGVACSTEDAMRILGILEAA